MRNFFLILSCIIGTCIQSQSISEIKEQLAKRPIQVGDSAPDFILTVGDNSIRSFSMRKLKRLSLLHFWNTTDANSKIDRGYLLRLFDHYENASFINATGFEIIAIAVQKDLETWRSTIDQDSLSKFTHGVAINGLEDDVCKNYNISALPGEILVDERGIVIAINPRMVEIENQLDNRKNYQALKKEITGFIASSSDKSKVLKRTNLYLFNYYGDSIAKTITDDKGMFTLNEIKLNQDFILKSDNRFNSSVALYTSEGEFVMDGKLSGDNYVFGVTTRMANRLLVHDSPNEGKHQVEELDVIKSLKFSDNGLKLTSKDEKELDIIVFDMKKNPALYLDFTVHTDSKIDEVRAMEITSNQVNAIKDYFHKKGLDLCHITGIAKGNSEMRKLCLGNADCTEEDHKLNRRVEFWLFKEPTLTE